MRRNPATVRKRSEIECAVAEQLSELFQKISSLLHEKLSAPLDRSSEQAIIRSANRIVFPGAPWRCLRALAAAMVIGTEHACFSVPFAFPNRHHRSDSHSASPPARLKQIGIPDLS